MKPGFVGHHPLAVISGYDVVQTEEDTSTAFENFGCEKFARFLSGKKSKILY